MAGGLIQRGAFVKAATSGDYGKPRPALVIQSDLFIEVPSIVICPLTTWIGNDAGLFRIDVEPSAANGLREPSQISIDKMTTIPRAKIGAMIGKADDELLVLVNRALAMFLGIA